MPDESGIGRRGFLLGTGVAGAAHRAPACSPEDGVERYPYATDALIAALRAPTLPRLAPNTTLIHDPEPGAYQYSHHPHIIHCFGTFLAMWSSGMVREDRPGQRILWSRSVDGKTWSKPQVLRECPEPPWRLTAGGWAAKGDRVYAFINRNRHPENDSLRAGVIWYPPLYLDVMEAGADFHWSAPRTIDSDIVANESPRLTSPAPGCWPATAPGWNRACCAVARARPRSTSSTRFLASSLRRMS